MPCDTRAKMTQHPIPLPSKRFFFRADSLHKTWVLDFFFVRVRFGESFHFRLLSGLFTGADPFTAAPPKDDIDLHTEVHPRWV